MPLRRGQPVTHRPSGLTDAPDGTNARPGSMASLQNLVPSRTAAGLYVCRPAAEEIFNFFNLSNPGFISGMCIVGDTLFGMIASDLSPGFDEPFAYDLVNNVFLPVSGINPLNMPSSPPATGDWVPPVMAQVGTRIVVTHPGFPGDSGVSNSASNFTKIGWFDISQFSSTQEVDIVNQLFFVYGGPGLVAGVQPGMTVGGSALIPAGATVARTFPNSQSANYFVADSHGSTTIDNITIPDHVEMYPGKLILGPGVQPGTTVIAVPTGSSITLSQPTTTSVVGGTFLISGNIPNLPGYASVGDFLTGSASITNAVVTDVHTGQTITSSNLPASTVVTGVSGTTIFLSQQATGTATLAPFLCAGSVIEMNASAGGSGQGPVVIAGGTPTVPLWGAGDTSPAGNVLPSVPLGVSNSPAGRAYYACGLDGIVFSDSLLATIVSNTSAIQAIKEFDGRPITAIAPLMLTTPLTGGVIQAVLAFQAAQGLLIIKGDLATSDLSVNGLPVATGTLAPNSIDVSTGGTYFVSPDGLRRVGFDGTVSDPIGQNGAGITSPMLQCGTPSRIAVCADRDTIRVSVPGPTLAAPTYDYWYHVPTDTWSGPHTFPASICRGWDNTIITAPAGIIGSLWQSDLYPTAASLYTENGNPLQWVYAPSALPDTGLTQMNALIRMLVAIELSLGKVATAIAQDITLGTYLDTTTIAASSGGTVWNAFNWNQASWGVGGSTYEQRKINWNRPLEFKQLLLTLTGSSDGNVKLGNLYMVYQILGYALEDIGL